MSFGISPSVAMTSMVRKASRAHTVFAFDDVKNKKDVVIDKVTTSMPPPNFGVARPNHTATVVPITPLLSNLEISENDVYDEKSDFNNTDVLFFLSDTGSFVSSSSLTTPSQNVSKTSTASKTTAVSSTKLKQTPGPKYLGFNKSKLLYMQDRIMPKNMLAEE